MELIQAFDIYRMIGQCCQARGGVAGLSPQQRDSFSRAMREVGEVFVIAADVERSKSESVEAITGSDEYRMMDEFMYGEPRIRPAGDVFSEFSDICAFIAENLELGTDWQDDHQEVQQEQERLRPEPTCRGFGPEPTDEADGE